MQFGRNSSAISMCIVGLKKIEISINLSPKTHWFGKMRYKMVRKHKLEDNSGTITCMYDWLSMNERRDTTCDTIYIYNVCHSQTKCTLTNIDQIESLQLVHFFLFVMCYLYCYVWIMFIRIPLIITWYFIHYYFD